jgi:hypothetical protein
MNQNLFPTSIHIIYIYEGHYPNIQFVLKHNQEIFYRPRIQKKLMVALSPTHPLTIQLNKLKVNYF